MLVISHRSAAYRQTHIEPLIMCCDKNQIGSIFGEWRKKAQTPILTSRSGGCTFLPLSLSSLCSCSLFVDFLISVLTVFFSPLFGFSILIMASQFACERKLHTSNGYKISSEQFGVWVRLFPMLLLFLHGSAFPPSLSFYALFKCYRKLILSLAFNIRCWVLGTRSHLRIQVHIKALLD